MFKDVNELKEFLVWAKEQKISEINIGEVRAKFHDLSFVEELYNKEMNLDTSKALVDSDDSPSKEDEELLMWSAQGQCKK